MISPFEPLSEVPLKWLTYKIVFLLALSSGERKDEINVCIHSSISSRRNCSEVTLSPLPTFLAKNQLPSEGRDSIEPVVIPALTTILDNLLKTELIKDRLICPVRALRIYLEKTKSLRKGKAFLFVSLREGYSKDTSRITISLWISQTIHTSYQLADMVDQQVAILKWQFRIKV